jgi:3-oxoacyl-[acyl-carrier protein] reductase
LTYTNLPSSASVSDALSLEGKVALITAGASGIGRAASELFAAHGAHVIIVDMNSAAAEDTAEGIGKRGGSAEAHAVDLSGQRATETFLEKLRSTHQVVDVLYNHVGVTGPKALEFDFASWNACMTVNAWVPMFMTQQVLPLLRRSESASIIFTASTAGLVGVPTLLVYAASKGAVIQFMRSVALLVAGEGIRANAICPGGTDTPGMRRDIREQVVDTTLEMIGKGVPMGRVGTPEDIASAALFLASDASRYLTGAVIPVDGGATTGSARS